MPCLDMVLGPYYGAVVARDGPPGRDLSTKGIRKEHALANESRYPYVNLDGTQIHVGSVITYVNSLRELGCDTVLNFQQWQILVLEQLP